MNKSFRIVLLSSIFSLGFVSVSGYAGSWAHSLYSSIRCDDDRAFCLDNGDCLCVPKGTACNKQGCSEIPGTGDWMWNNGEWRCLGGINKLDGFCCPADMGWNGTKCVNCFVSGGDAPFVGSGGSPETACTCKNKAADGSCISCSSGYGWNGTTCVDCADGTIGVGGSITTACNCIGGRKTDGSCCSADTGWNGTTCVSCWGSSGPYSPGVGGTPETACTCESKATDGSCISCSSGYGWNGTTCVDCADGTIGVGGSITTACNCIGGRKTDGSCCPADTGWNGTTCVSCWGSSEPYSPGIGGTPETACTCESKAADGSCISCSSGYGWNGTTCVDCTSNPPGVGGTPETACNCSYYNAGRKPDGSCCDSDSGWNGTTCVYCALNPPGVGGTPETACECREDQERGSDGSCL